MNSQEVLRTASTAGTPLRSGLDTTRWPRLADFIADAQVALRAIGPEELKELRNLFKTAISKGSFEKVAPGKVGRQFPQGATLKKLGYRGTFGGEMVTDALVAKVFSGGKEKYQFVLDTGPHRFATKFFTM